MQSRFSNDPPEDGPPARWEAALFDLDGTLVDHFTTIYRACNRAFAEMGCPSVDYATVRSTVGGSIHITMQRLVGEDRATEAVERFRAHFDRTWTEDLRILPGARELLEGLRRVGVRTAVFTNKEGDRARAVTRHLGLDGLVDHVIGTEDTPWRKPDPAFTRHVLGKVDRPAEKSCLVGDSPFDAEAAHAVAMPVFLVGTGSHKPSELEGCGARGVFESLHTLAPPVFGFALNGTGMAAPVGNA